MTKQKTEAQAAVQEPLVVDEIPNDQGVSNDPVDPPVDVAKQDGSIEVRVLYACELGKTNEVITVQASEVEGLQRAGYVDADPAAVAYAKLLIVPKPVEPKQ